MASLNILSNVSKRNNRRKRRKESTTFENTRTLLKKTCAANLSQENHFLIGEKNIVKEIVQCWFWKNNDKDKEDMISLVACLPWLCAYIKPFEKRILALFAKRI